MPVPPSLLISKLLAKLDTLYLIPTPLIVPVTSIPPLAVLKTVEPKCFKTTVPPLPPSVQVM